MSKAYRVSRGNRVLLLGEGNFSFCRDFIILNENLLLHEFSTLGIVATCKESKAEDFSEFKQDNIRYITSKGVIVHYNVDATNLKCHSIIKHEKYDKIIFNFPHVGGKMKIHLNRKLLKDFFCSACDVLNEDGSIVVALCDGQGGTEADRKQRNWNDSWQITEMAAQSDLILYKVETFDVACFPNYVNVGYRSCEKSFHCENAVVHLFRRHKRPRILQVDPDMWSRTEGDNENLIFEALDKYLLNPWSYHQSASSYIFQNLLKKIDSDSTLFEHKSVVRYSLSMSTNVTNIGVDCKEIVSSLLDIFNSLNMKNTAINLETSCIVMRSLMTKSVLLKDFSSPPVRCQVLVFGQKLNALLHSYVIGLLEFFDSKWLVSVNESDDLSHWRLSLFEPNSDQNHQLDSTTIQHRAVNIIDSVFLPNGVPCHMIHIDELSQILFKIKDWRSLWDGTVDASTPNQPTFSPTVMFPKEYSFDLGLSVPLQNKNGFEEEFYVTLWLLAGDIIVKVEHLTTYEPTDRELICYCYRITYKSYSAPLHRKRVIYFHEKIIAKVISKILRVNIT